MIICGKEVIQIKAPDFMELLKDKRNLLVYGNSGLGKTSIVRAYAKKHKLKLKIINLATKLPEAIGGIPSVQKDGEYYKELLSEELREVFEDDGDGWVVFFDEINQGSPEIFNTMYGICYPFGEDRLWCGHSLSKAQIVACGNLDDGSDGTVYLNELPTPLHNRFSVFELVGDNKSTLEYLREKFKGLSCVQSYIEAMQEANTNPRDIEECLDILKNNHNTLYLQAKLGVALSRKLLEIQSKTKVPDPAKLFKLAQHIYTQYLENDNQVMWGVEIITDTDSLIAKFKEAGLTEDEIKSIISK